jgi:hypothetical protein
MNVIIDTLIRFFTAVSNGSVQILQNDSPYTTAMVILYIILRNDYKGQIYYSLQRIQRSQQQTRPFTLSKNAWLY